MKYDIKQSLIASSLIVMCLAIYLIRSPAIIYFFVILSPCMQHLLHIKSERMDKKQ